MDDMVDTNRVSVDGISLAEMKRRAKQSVPDVAARIAKAVMDAVPDDIVRELARHIYGDLNSRLATAAPHPNPSNEPVIQLWPSEVGSYVGQDTWRTRDQALADVWERTHGSSFRAERGAWLARGRTLRGHAAAAVSLERNQAAAVDPYPHIATTQAVARFCSSASPQDMLKLFKTKGTVLEEQTADMLAAELGQALSLRNSAAMWRPGGVQSAVPVTAARSRPGGPITDPGPYVFSGAVDGWLTQEPFKDVIVELKLRMRAIPASIPLRDILQVQTYMAMHDVQRAAHVQRVIGTSQLVINMVERDETLWNGVVMPDIVRFVCDVRRLLRGEAEDDGIRHRVLSAAEKVALPLAQLSTVMASELRTFKAAEAEAEAKVEAEAHAEVEPKVKESDVLSSCTMNHHGIEVIGSALALAPVLIPTLVSTSSTSTSASASASASASVLGKRKRKRRAHPDDNLIRLPASPSKRSVVAALRDVLSLSSRVKRNSVASQPAYNTRARSKSK